MLSSVDGEVDDGVLDDEGNWLARPVFIMVGEDNLIFGKGSEGGKDGLLAKDL